MPQCRNVSRSGVVHLAMQTARVSGDIGQLCGSNRGAVKKHESRRGANGSRNPTSCRPMCEDLILS